MWAGAVSPPARIFFCKKWIQNSVCSEAQHDPAGRENVVLPGAGTNQRGERHAGIKIAHLAAEAEKRRNLKIHSRAELHRVGVVRRGVSGIARATKMRQPAAHG